MIKCKCCHRKFAREDHGQSVEADGMVLMGFGSKYDLDIYQFTLVPGWYCHCCLDAEVRHGLCQPVRVGVRRDQWVSFRQAELCPQLIAAQMELIRFVFSARNRNAATNG
jgi:hypothetical protein